MTRYSICIAMGFAAACGLSHRSDDTGAEGGTDPMDASAPGARRDAGPGPVPDAFRGVGDAGPTGTPDGVRCGTEVCVVGTEACRATCQPATCVDAPEDWRTGECAIAEDETFPIVVARCDGPEDCGAEEHCGVLLGSVGNYPRCLPCDDATDCVPPGRPSLCHTLADCPAWAGGCRPNLDLLHGFYATCVE